MELLLKMYILFLGFRRPEVEFYETPSHPTELTPNETARSLRLRLDSDLRSVQIRLLICKVSLTAQFDPNEVFDAQVLQEDTRG